MTTWEPNWQSLNGIADSYAASSLLGPQIQTSTPVGGYIAVGLHLTLAEILKAANKVIDPMTGPLIIAVDTLVLPPGKTKIDASAIAIVARSLSVPDKGTATLTTDSDLQVVTASIAGTIAIEGKNKATLALATDQPKPQALTVSSGEVSISSSAQDVADAIHSPWNLLAIELSYTIAGVVLDQGESESILLAQNMLRWVTANGHALLQQQSAFPNVDYSNVASLQSSAISLLSFTQASFSKATYVPVLSDTIYKQQIEALLKVAEVYDQKISALKEQKNLEQLLASFAQTLGNVKKTAEIPLFNTLKRLDNEQGLLREQLLNASVQLANVSKTIAPLQEELVKAIEDQFQQELLKAGIDTFLTVLTFYAAAGLAILDDPSAFEKFTKAEAKELKKQVEIAANITTQAFLRGQSLEGIITRGFTSVSGAPGKEAAKEASQGAEYMMGSVIGLGQASAILWGLVNQAIVGGLNKINITPDILAAVEKMPNVSGLSVAGLDPVSYWKTTVVQTQAYVQPYKDSISIANTYLEAVELAAIYGQSVGDLQMKLLDLYNQGLAAFDRLRAVYQAEAQWESLQKSLEQKSQQADAAIGLLQRGYLHIKRNVVVAVENYRAAFKYQWLQNSEVKVNAAMDYLQLVQSAENSVSDLQNVLAGKPSGTIRPRQNYKNVTYIVKSEASPLFSEVDGKGRAQWSIDLNNTELAEQLSGNTAIYLTKAKFELHGARQRGEVELQITISGNYDNKRNNTFFRFVSQPVSMTNNYKPGPPIHFITTWHFADAAAYLTPTPYTSWTLDVIKGNWKEVKSIKMTISGVFLQNH